MGDPRLNPAEYDFIAARRRTEAKAKSAAEKLTSLEDAVGRVKDGDHIGVGGCLFSRTPMALMREILRQRRRGLTLARNLTCNEGELFMAAGAASRVMTAWMSIGLPWGVSKILRHYVETGAVALEEWSHLALGLRFRAGAMGVPFLPALTMLGSDLVGVGGLKTVQDPYTGETLRRCRRSSRTWRCRTCTARIGSATARSTATRTWTPTSRGPRRRSW